METVEEEPEVPVESQKEPVADIPPDIQNNEADIPLENSQVAKKTPRVPLEKLEPKLEDIFREEPVAKKRGRPAGAKNKPKVISVKVAPRQIEKPKEAEVEKVRIIEKVRPPTFDEITAWQEAQFSAKRQSVVKSWADQIERSFC